MTPRRRPGFALWAFTGWLAATLLWWALAFAPLPLPAVWLAEARSVCFGTLPNGLPDTWGWAGLVVSPLAVLAFLLAVWGRELRAQLAGLTTSVAGRLLLVTLAATPLVGVAWVSHRLADARRVAAAAELATLPEELPDSYPRGRDPAPALDLVDQSGEIVSVAELAGKPTLLTFAFAHCQTVCPVVVNTVRQAAVELSSLEPRVVIVTLDPWRDTPSSLPTLVRSWNLEELPDVHVLSGEVDAVLAALERWQMPITRNTQNGDIAHPALVRVLAPDGSLAFSFTNPPVEWVVAAAERTLEETGSRESQAGEAWASAQRHRFRTAPQDSTRVSTSHAMGGT